MSNPKNKQTLEICDHGQIKTRAPWMCAAIIAIMSPAVISPAQAGPITAGIRVGSGFLLQVADNSKDKDNRNDEHKGCGGSADCRNGRRPCRRTR